MTPDQLRTIENEVKTWMEAERMFTAYEISRAVRAKGVDLRHREMKDAIHAAIYRRRSRSYSRTLVDVGAPERAWVYHPMTKNPHQFNPLDRGGSSSSPAAIPDPSRTADGSTNRPFHAKNLTPLSTNEAPPSTSSQGALACDQDGNLLIPKSRIESLGIGPNENLFVLSDTDESALEICKSDPESDTPSESISSNARSS